MACPVALLSLATATPPHTLDQAEALAVAHDVLATDYADFERMTQVFASAGIAQRHLARPIAWYRQPRSFPERTAAYLETASDLFVAAATQALTAADIAAGDVDTIVTASSTGIATPSLEARVVGRMGLAAQQAAANPGSVVLFVTVELCSLAFRSHAIGKADRIATALFAIRAAQRWSIRLNRRWGWIKARSTMSAMCCAIMAICRRPPRCLCWIGCGKAACHRSAWLTALGPGFTLSTLTLKATA